MSIAQLLQAAEYLERREREAEHGYACSLPIPDDHNQQHLDDEGEIKLSASPNSLRKSQGSRSTHNELEKNRRAHLRYCLEKLKEMVPLGSEASKHTTLGLLTKAKAFIRALEEKDKKQTMIKDNLFREQRYLKRRLDALKSAKLYRNSRAERTISECSTGTLSNASTASVSTEEPDEVDVLGSHSESDEPGVSGSDGGMTVTTKKLSLMDSL